MSLNLKYKSFRGLQQYKNFYHDLSRVKTILKISLCKNYKSVMKHKAAQLYQGYIAQQNLSELILSSLLNTDAQRKMQTHDVLF